MFFGLENQPAESAAVRDQRGCSLTYGELCEEVSVMQGALHGRALAFILCENTVGSLIGYLAMLESGIVPVLLSSRLDEELLANLYRIYAPSYVWLSLDGLKSGLQVGGSRSQSEAVLYERFGFALIATGNEPYLLNELLALCMSTSGSTGSPKLVRYTRDNLEANARNVALAFEWSAAERAFADLGMQYTMGLNVINTHLSVGAEVVFCESNPMSSDYWDCLSSSKATNITGVPFSYEIFHRLHLPQRDLPYLRTLAEGGGKLSDERFKEFADYAQENGKRFIATFGTTETAARMSYLPAGYAQEKTGSIGMAIPQGEMYLVDAEGTRINEMVAEGELCYKGPNVTMGYAECKEDLALGDVWHGVYRTGDLARRDEHGFYYVTGRLSRFVKLLGHRISLDECERILQEELNASCACVGDDSAIMIFCEDAALVDDCSQILQNKIGLRVSQCQCAHIPSIPRSDNGKIQYKKLIP